MLTYRRVERLATEDDLILDLGTKDGRHLDGLPGRVIAIDLTFQFPLKTPGPHYAYADGRRLPFNSDTFDFVILEQVLEHVSDRKSMVAEISRVLKPGGSVLFSFPNRLTPNKPHGLPRWMSMLPKSVGKRIGRHVLSDEQYTYYTDGVFPLSPVGARRLFAAHFETIEYVTINESVKSKGIYGDRFAPQLFVTMLPLVALVARIPPFHLAFEVVWGHAAYVCRN